MRVSAIGCAFDSLAEVLYEVRQSAVRKAISIGGDSDTIACMTDGIAHAYYKKIPNAIYSRAVTCLDSGLKDTLRRFEEQFQIPR